MGIRREHQKVKEKQVVASKRTLGWQGKHCRFMPEQKTGQRKMGQLWVTSPEGATVSGQ